MNKEKNPKIRIISESQLVQNDSMVMQAQSELEHFSSDAEMQEIEHRRKLGKLEYYSGLYASREEGIIIGEKRGVKKGRKKGRKEGLEEGRKEGEVTGKVKNIVRALQRSHESLPESLVEKIYKITDLQFLDQLLDIAYAGVSLEDFEKMLHKKHENEQ